MEWGWTGSAIVGIGASFAGTVFVAVLIYCRQKSEQRQLTNTVRKIDGAVSGLDSAVADVNDAVGRVDGAVGGVDRAVTDVNYAVTRVDEAVQGIDRAVADVAEMLAERDEQEIADDADDAGVEGANLADGNKPANEGVYLDALKRRGVDPGDSYRWARKSRKEGEGRGNLGWFITLDDGRRFFVHHGRKTKVRQAIPKELLNEWKAKADREPTDIELDYQTGKGRGNHAWFIRTYDGERWRIARGKGSITVEKLDEVSE